LDFDEDFYSVLEIDPAISSKDMKKAYYKIVFKYHPDNKETAEAKALGNKQMMVINAAYKVLKDADARAVYDRKRQAGVYGGAASKVGARSSSSSSRSSSSSSSSSRSSAQGSSAGSGSSSGDPFGGFWGNNGNSNAEYTTTDSLGDIFSELWSEIRKGEGKNIVGDVLEFLEDQVRVHVLFSCFLCGCLFP
jgi:DnaJ-class molecular chaperone